jgi:hypothetical protein
MSCCQKCWRDAHRGEQYSVAEKYQQLIEERKNNPCLPEEQAGEDAKYCPICERRTVHEITGECMICGLGDRQ